MGSLSAALLFALHPVQSEAVNAVVGRADLLAFALALSSFLLFAESASPFAIAALFLLALLSKESAAFALPLFLLHSRQAKRLVPLAAALAAYAGVRVAVLGGLGVSGREIGFLDNPLADASLATRALAAPVLIFRYIGLILWPRVLSADYSFDQIPVPEGILDARVGLGIALLVGAAFIATRSGKFRFAVLAFVLPLLCSLHLLFPLGTLFAERLLYLPMLGAALTFGRGIENLFERKSAIGLVVLGLVVVASAAQLWSRNLDWRDNETLFRRTVETAPESARSHFLLGAELFEKKAFVEASKRFEDGLRIYPNHFGALMSLGEARLGAGDLRGAEEAFRSSLRLVPSSAEARRAAFEAALAYGRAGARAEDFATAEDAFRRGIELDESDPSAWNYLGLVHEQQGRVTEAREAYERALASDADYVPALLNLASIRSNSGELHAAEEIYRRAIGLAPDSYEAYNGLGIVLARQGRRSEAVAAFEKAIAIEPGLGAARENLRNLR
ncbi:MAG TPA: tetratricopeptide repeat protein [Vicinamibacteria bacterium]|nr:tetratricopeptide repeat protein [Vicinamibacteria bacterium]